MERIKSIDLARGFTVFFIPIVHSVMLYGKPAVHASGFGKTLAFVAEWPGAQVFMLLMGVSFALSKQNNFQKVLLRSVVLLVFGYLLNAMKFIGPYFIGGLPNSFMNDAGMDGLQSLLLIGDIFHLASLSLIVLYIVKRFKEYAVVAILLSIVVCLSSPQLWDLHSNNFIINHFLQLITAGPPHVYFPLLPWIVYQLTGIAIGYFLKGDIDFTHIVLMIIGGGLFVLANTIYSIYPGDQHSFYRTESWDTIRHVGFVLLWVSLWHWACKYVPDNFIFRFLEWCSKRITLIYVIQWPLIFWLLPLFGYQQFDLVASIVSSIAMSLIVFLLCFLMDKKFNRVSPDRAS